MTNFERATVSLIFHLFVDEIGKSKVIGRVVKRVNRVNLKAERIYETKKVSWGGIDFECLDQEERYKVYSEKDVTSTKTVVKTEEHEHDEIDLHNLGQSVVSGSVRGYQFKIEYQGYGSVKVTDGEQGNKTYSYKITN